MVKFLKKRSRADIPDGGGSVENLQLANSICVPCSGGAKMAFVLGVHWTPHLAHNEAVFSIASKAARLSKASHIYAKSKGDYFGISKLDDRDTKSFDALVPLTVAFGQSVTDKNLRSVFVVDMRSDGEDGDKKNIYIGVAFRGVPLTETICSVSEMYSFLSRQAADASTGINVCVHSESDAFFDKIAGIYPSASAMSISNITAKAADGMKRPPAIQITRSQGVLVALLILGYVGYTYGFDYYKKNIDAQKQQDVQQQVRTNFVNQSQQDFKIGYPISALGGLSAVAEISKMPVMRNGWEFQKAECSTVEEKCALTWVRVYGTYDTFIESAKPENVVVNPKDYKTIIENRIFQLPSLGKPLFSDLIDDASFIRENGDRQDTFSLANVTTFNVEALADAVPWVGVGAPPILVLSKAKWSMESSLDQVEEAVKNNRLTKEFGVTTIVVSQKEGNVTLKLEGNVYVRKS